MRPGGSGGSIRWMILVSGGSLSKTIIAKPGALSYTLTTPPHSSFRWIEAWLATELFGKCGIYRAPATPKRCRCFIAPAVPAKVSPYNAAKADQIPTTAIDPVCRPPLTNTAPPRNGCSPGTPGAARLPRRPVRFPGCAPGGRWWVWPNSPGGQKSPRPAGPAPKC